MATEKLILALRSGFQTDDWLMKEYGDLISMLERETGLKLCIYGKDSPSSVRDRVIRADIDTVLVATGGVESTFVDLEPHIARDGRSMSLIADGRNNSLAASLEILTYFANKNRSGRIVHAPTNAEIVQNLLHPTTKTEPETLLKGCKIGCVGQPSDWLIASDVDRTLLLEKYGVTVIDVPMDDLISEYSKVDSAEAEKLATAYMANIAFITEPTREDMLRSVRIYYALKHICTEHGLSALTIRCFDVINALNATSCVALSMLNDEGIVATCEGDMQSMMTMLLVRRLLDLPSFMANPSGLRAGETVLAHCTVPQTMLISCSAFAL